MSVKKIATLTIVVVLIVTIIAFVKSYNTMHQWDTNKEIITVRVKSGDTLWDYAKQYAPSGMDIRSYILEIVELNDLSSSEIYAGQILDLYVEGTHEHH